MEQTRIDMAKEALAQLDQQISKLQMLRGAWKTILQAESEIASLPAPERPTQKDAPPPTANGHQRAVSKSYGDKSDKLRRFVVSRGDTGVTRMEIMKEAERIGKINDGYRFISRSKDRHELIERDGRFFATQRMSESLRSDGVQSVH
jgi:hypothetical protein